MHLGLWEQYVKSLGLTPFGFDILFHTRPRALGQQHQPTPPHHPTPPPTPNPQPQPRHGCNPLITAHGK